MPSDIQSRFEVVSSEMILTELIENIEIVQKDPSQLESFLTVYCIKTQKTIKPDTERIDDLEAEIALSDEQIANLSNEDDPKLIPCGCSENISKYDCKRFGCLRETL